VSGGLGSCKDRGSVIVCGLDGRPEVCVDVTLSAVFTVTSAFRGACEGLDTVFAWCSALFCAYRELVRYLRGHRLRLSYEFDDTWLSKLS